MGDKDFAQLEQHPFEDEKQTSSSGSKSAIISILALMFAITCFAVGFFMGEKFGLETNKGNKHEALLETLHEQQQKLESYKKEAEKWHQKEASTSQVGELTFYNELPKQSVVPEPLDGTAKVEKNAQDHPVIDEKQEDIALTEKRLDAIIEQELQTPTRQYRIQIASFKHRKDASNLVNQLKISGVDANIQQVNLATIGVRYRVLTLPFNQRSHALQTKQDIKDKFHITGILVTE